MSRIDGAALTRGAFAELVWFIHEARMEGGHVYVHCMAGISRSTTVTTACACRCCCLARPAVVDDAWRRPHVPPRRFVRDGPACTAQTKVIEPPRLWDRLVVDGVRVHRRCVAPNPGFAVQLRQFDRDPKRRELMDRMRQHPVSAISRTLVRACMHAPRPTLATNGSPAAARQRAPLLARARGCAAGGTGGCARCGANDGRAHGPQKQAELAKVDMEQLGIRPGPPAPAAPAADAETDV
jgi:hypothetical protein